jgi:hypothetical protein
MNYRNVMTVLLISVIFSCSESPDTYTVETIDGVKHIHNIAPKWGDEPEIKLEFVKKIGELESDDENLLLYRPTDVYIDSDNNYFILESGASTIKKFDADGNYLMTIGRKGQGPGEMQMVYRINHDADNNLILLDVGNMRIQKYSPDGADLGSTRFDPSMNILEILNNGNLIAGNISMKTEENDGKTAKLCDPERNVLRKFSEARPVEDQQLYLIYNMIFVTSDQKNNIYVTYFKQNRVEKFDRNGDCLFRADRPLNFEETNKPVYGDISFPTGGSMKMPIINDVSNSIEVDSKGRLWIKSLTKSIDMNKYTSFRIFGDRIFFIDSGKEMAVFEYTIVE